jgi:hypothetical protein
MLTIPSFSVIIKIKTKRLISKFLLIGGPTETAIKGLHLK